MAVERLLEVLRKASEVGASDVHIGAGTPVRVRLKGKLEPLKLAPFRPEETIEAAFEILRASGRIPAGKENEFMRAVRDEDCAFGAPGLGRFRVNIACQRGTVALVMRLISSTIPTIEGLGLPDVLSKIASEERGLVLVTGITGSGKSTTLAAMLGHINRTRPCKVVTVEDPIEYLYKDDKASITQREVGADTRDFGQAIRAALRQDPDVILVGEMRDRETIDTALKAAETGHLVLSTVHTTDAQKTLTRIMAVFDLSEQGVIRLRLADALQAIISQRLLPRADGKGRVAAVEIMRNTPTIKDCILNEGKTHGILDYIKTGREQYGMQSFDQHLMEMVEAGLLDFQTAKTAASSPSEFERNLVFV